MDLTRMLNTDPGGVVATASPPPRTRPPPQASQLPSTPVQTAPSHSFRDYGPAQPMQASPVRQMPLDFATIQPSQPTQAHTPGGQPPYASSPPPYHGPASGPGPAIYGGRPAPPPLQPVIGSDTRSPSLSVMPAPSPYRQTPTGPQSAVAGGPQGGYPFPPTQGHPAPTSPAQRHQQYPPGGTFARADSFSHPSATLGAGPHGSSAYVPQTPPVGTPGSAHPTLHQRSQSTHSTPTPTSAHSQHAYGAPGASYVQGSPIVSHHGLPPQQPPQHEQYRQSSQPPTPIGPSLPGGPPRSSSTVSYVQPQSPYQQRAPSIGSFPPHHPHQQTSPPPPAPPSIPRAPSNHSAYDVDSQCRSQSRSERERSISVSPKTRVPSLPSSTGLPASATSSTHEQDFHQQPYMTKSSNSRQAIAPSPSQTQAQLPPPGHAAVTMEPGRDRAITPGKRKMDDRDLQPDEIAHQEGRPPPFETVNGSHSAGSRTSTSPVIRRKKTRYTEPPVWALSIDDLKRRSKLRGEEFQLRTTGFILRKSVHAHANGKRDTSSRHASPEATRAANPQPQPQQQPQPQSHHQAQPAPISPPGPDLTLLGPWEPTIANKKPQEEMVKAVADWLFFTVVTNKFMGEITSRGIHFEIEAKLGTCINKDTTQRIKLPVTTECTLEPSNRWAFQSSMNEEQHQRFNAFLNDHVKAAHQHNPEAVQRVHIDYKHSREIDKFYEMPRELLDRLPVCVKNYNSQHGRHGVKVRVTYQQQEHDGVRRLVPTAQILKARVADLDIHFPQSPLDCRVSVNLEMPWDGSLEEIERLGISDPARTPDRHKDRLSYKQGPYQIDLTQVTQTVVGPGNNPPQAKKEHELEIELSPDHLLKHGQLLLSKERHNYAELVEGMVDNIRLLVQQAGKWAGPTG